MERAMAVETQVPAGRALLPPTVGYSLKRAVLGRPLPTSALAHERLGKPTALAVFASDNLSSVAYATEEILKVAVPVAGLAAFGVVMPVTIGILAVLAILLFSYRQTIKAYPSAGGAYIVTKDNFGLLTAQIAGVALLTDYVLTVAVSASAGIAAVTSAFPDLYGQRVPLTVICIWFIAWGNLRGVRESGRMFAAPTYFFIAMMVLLLVIGVIRALTGGLHPIPEPSDVAIGTGAISTFLILHAFASGGAAVTGVEAISNGVPAFRPPEWKNARTTLMWMGTTLGVMFLGLSFLAMRLRVIPSENKTVISEVGRAVFGTGAVGYALFLALQIATTLILILAANTSFADFPRLANFHAGDDFMPRQLTKRGQRLVFSNGIVGLAVASTALVILLEADVHRLIPLYAIGVFTSFTLSQGGMARRHLRIKEPGWRVGLLINGVGAVTTGVVAVVVAATKFWEGAWAVMLFVPVMVWLLVRMNRLYERERRELVEDLTPFEQESRNAPRVVVIVEQLDRAALHALQYARTIRTRRTRAVHVDVDGDATVRLVRRWAELGTDIPLDVLPVHGDTAATIGEYVSRLPDDTDISVILPAPGDQPRGERIRRRRLASSLTRRLLDVEGARLTVVRDHPGPGHDPTPARLRVAPARSHRALVLVDKADRATMRAVRYALSLGAAEVTAVHAAADHEQEQRLIRRWMDLHVPIPLDVIECWDRNVPRALEQYAVELMSRRHEITIVMARRDYARLRQRILHDRTSGRIARAVGRYQHVDVAVVPYFFRSGRGRSAWPGTPGRPGRSPRRGSGTPRDIHRTPAGTG
jgi:amino acid transporter